MIFNWLLIIYIVEIVQPKQITITHQNNKIVEVKIIDGCKQDHQLLIISNNLEILNMQWLGSTEKLQLNLTMIDLIKSHGYMREENDSFNKNKFIGYTYYKQKNKNKKIVDQTHNFLKSLRDILWANVRIEDKYSVSINENHHVCSLNLQYTYPTLNVSQAPSEAKIIAHKDKNQLVNGNIKLSGRGFHQKINYTIQLQPQIDISIIPNECALIITDIIPEDIYVDLYQLQNSTYYQTINIQNPAYNSKQYYFINTIKFSQAIQVGKRKYLFQQPIHFRYGLPSNQSYVSIDLHPIKQMRIQCWSTHTIQLIVKDLSTQRGRAKIPVGNLNSARYVSLVTLVCCLIGAMIITKNLKNTS